jgi:hypothetical protein
MRRRAHAHAHAHGYEYEYEYEYEYDNESASVQPREGTHTLHEREVVARCFLVACGDCAEPLDPVEEQLDVVRAIRS